MVKPVKPTQEELQLWKSRCAPVTGTWQDKALHQLCSYLLDEPERSLGYLENLQAALDLLVKCSETVPEGPNKLFHKRAMARCLRELLDAMELAKMPAHFP
jgi:hypothetical protein